MPLFSLGDDDDGDAEDFAISRPSSISSPSFSSPPYGDRHVNQNEKSVQLVCTSPDGNFLGTYSSAGGGYIEMKSLPLTPQRESRLDKSDAVRAVPRRIRIALPDWLKSSLRIDPPVQLLCVEGENRSRGNKMDRRQSLPLLCLYSKKGIFLLESAYESPSENDDVPDSVNGVLISVTQPFEQILETSLAHEVVRVRPAPQRFDGFATMCNRGCVAALIRNTDFQEYSLYLYHGKRQITAPLSFGVEELQDPSREQIVDFCFAQSSELSLLPSLSVLFLKGSGDLYSASPIVFDGAVISTASLLESLDYLDAVIQSETSPTPKRRQHLAAKQVITDIFSPARISQFATAQVLSQLHQPNSVLNWPIQLQGPVMFYGNDDDTPAALVLENFGRTQSSVVGVAVGKKGYSVDFGALSPTALVPRFAFETNFDRQELDDNVFKLGAWVERLKLSSSTEEAANEQSIGLQKDSLDDTLLHFVTTRSVVTISTNAMRTLGTPANSDRTPPLRTTAWTCIESISGSIGLTGISVPQYEDDEHMMLACMDDGSIVSVNVREQKVKHEFDALRLQLGSQTKALLPPGSKGSSARDLLESSPPLVDKVGDIWRKVSSGLANMGKITGSQTSYTDITPEALAVAIKIKEQCDNEVVLPLLELNNVVQSRRRHLREVVTLQLSQLQELKKAEADRREQMEEMLNKIDNLESNAQILHERASHAYAATQGLVPTVTDAEQAFFKDIERLKEKCKFLQQQMKKVKESAQHQCSQLSESTVSDSLKPIDHEKAEKMNILMIDMGETMKRIRTRLLAAEAKTKSLAE